MDPIPPTTTTTPLTTTGSLSPKEEFPFSYIIAGAVGGTIFLVVVVAILVCCIYCFRRRWINKRQRTWTNRSVHQNGVHSYHNGAVGDVTSTMKEKEGGFDDPNDLLETPTSPSGLYGGDVILHVLSHAHLQEGDSPQASKKTNKKQGQRSGRGGSNGFHVNTHSNGSIAMGNGAITVSNGSIRTGHASSDSSSSPSSDAPMCPPPDYNDLFATSETTPKRHMTGNHHANGRGHWYGNAEDKV